MCLVAYIAAAEELPTLDWNHEIPAFHVKNIDEGIEKVRGQFRLPFVYYLGSHEGCGCGFNRGSASPSEPHQVEAVRQTLAALTRYLQEAVSQVGTIELYTCWNGEEGDRPEHAVTVAVNHFGSDMEWFREKCHATIVPNAAT